MTLNDLEFSKEGFLVIFLQFLSEAHISTVNCDEMHVKFLALNVDFSCRCLDPLGSRKPAQSGVKDSFSLKVVILPL